MTGARQVRRLGPYEVLEELGRGAVGVVYRGRHVELGLEVALKLLLTEEAPTPRQRERWMLEARATARLRHPNLVAVHDAGEVEGRPYLVLDLVERGSLAQRLAKEGPLDVREAATVTAKVARALHHAHEHLILHRDVKPANILLDARGEPRLGDFGLAKALDVDRVGATQTNGLVGTPGYAAPEQAGGGVVDVRTDVYGLGATLFELLVGEPPFTGDSVLELLARVATEEAPSLRPERPEIDRDLEVIALTCLAKDPADRYPNAAALAQDLERWLAGEPIQARPPSLVDRLWRRARRHRGATAAMAASLVVALTSLAGAALWARQGEARARARAVDAAAEEAAAAWSAASAATATTTTTDERITLALRALEAAQRRHDLAPDASTGRDVVRAALALVDLALETEQWALARHGAAAAEARGDEAQGALARVESARTRESERRRADVRRLLAEASSGALRRRPEGLPDAVFAIARYPEAAVVDELARALDAVSLRLSTGVGLEAGDEDCARVACEALGRLGVKDGAVTALGRYLAVESDEVRATLPALALVRLGGAEAQALVDAAFLRLRKEHFVRVVSEFQRARASTASAPTEVEARSEAWAEEAARRERAGDQRGALEAWDRAVELGSQKAVCLNNRSNLRSAMGDLAGAREDLDQAIALRPGYALAHSNRSHVSLLGGDAQAALVDAEEALRLDPKLALAHYNRAAARAALGRREEAVADLTRSLELDPNDPGVWVARGKEREVLHDDAGAIGDFGRAIKLAPTKPGGWRLRAMAYARQGRIEEAQSDAARALEVAPDDVDCLISVAQLRLLRGDVRVALGELDRAVELAPRRALLRCERAKTRLLGGDGVGAREDADEAVRLAAEEPAAWMTRGYVRWKTGDLRGGLADFDRALGIAPDDAPTLFNRGCLRRRLGDPTAARADVERAVASDPGYTPARTSRAELRRDEGDLRGALDDLDRVLALRPRDAEALAHRGSVKRALGDRTGATADFDAAIAIDPRCSFAYTNRSNLRLDAGDQAGALADLVEAIALAPDQAAPWANRGALRLQRGDVPGALDDLTRALELDPNHAGILVNRAVVLERTGDPAGARRDLDRALELAPNLPDALRRRANLRLAQSDFEGASTDLDRYLTLRARDGAGGEDPEVRRVRMELRLKRGDKAGALEDLDAVIAGTTTPPQQLLTSLLKRAQLRGDGAPVDRAAAIADLDRAVSLAPRSAVAWGMRGMLRTDPVAAAADLRRALELETDPANAATFRNKLAELEAAGH